MVELWGLAGALSLFLALCVLAGGVKGLAFWGLIVALLLMVLGITWSLQYGAIRLGRMLQDKEKRREMWIMIAALSAVAWFVTGSVSAAIVTGALFVGLACGGLALLSILSPLLPKANSNGAHGTARFQTQDEAAEKFHLNEGYVIGRNPNTGQLCRLISERHMLTVAPNRSGKGVGIVIPNLLKHPGSTVVIDVKGENALIAARRRKEFGEVVVLDPFGTTGLPCGVFNPLRAMMADSETLRDEAEVVAEMLVPGKPPGTQQDWWVTGARTLIAGIVMHTVTDPDEVADLGRVRDLLTLERDKTIDAMTQSTSMDVRKAAGDFLERSEKGRNDVLSTAKESTGFLDSPGIRRVVDGKSSFQATDLKKRVISVFVVLPPSRLSTYDKWLRLVIGNTVLGVTETIAKPKNNVLFLMDEFAQLGYLRPVRDALGLMAGYGLTVWPIVQDLNQLQDIYGKTWETFVSAAESVQYFNVSDQFTAEYVSKTLGQHTVEVKTSSQSTGTNKSDARQSETAGESVSSGFVGCPLLRPEQLVSEVPNNRMIVTLQGSRPAMLSKVRYFEDDEFSGLWDADKRKEGLSPTIPPAWYEQPATTKTDEIPVHINKNVIHLKKRVYRASWNDQKKEN